VSGRASRLLALSLLAVWGALVALSIVLELTGALDSSDETFLSVLTSGYAICGALVAARQPRNPIGWMMVAVAVILVLGAMAAGYVEPVDDPRDRIAGDLAVSYYMWAEQLWIPLAGILLPLLFPDGRLPSPRWRLLVWLTVGAAALGVVGAVFSPRLVDPSVWPGLVNPSGLGGTAGRVAEAAGVVSAVLFVPCFFAGGASVVVRLRRARGEERQQLKWFAYVAAVMGVALLVAGAAVLAEKAGAEERTWAYVVGASGWFTALAMILLGVPVAVGFAVFRYRLYDIDVVIRRTLVYGVLTAALAGAYLGLVLLLQLVFQPLTQGSDLAIAGSTLAVAALFRPARGRIQEVVDRRFYRRRYDAARTLEGFSARLREEVDLDSLSADLRSVVRETVQPAHVSLWLREAGR
jgi:hypothetical protein